MQTFTSVTSSSFLIHPVSIFPQPVQRLLGGLREQTAKVSGKRNWLKLSSKCRKSNLWHCTQHKPSEMVRQILLLSVHIWLKSLRALLLLCILFQFVVSISRQKDKKSAVKCQFWFLCREIMIGFSFVESSAAVEIYFTHVEKSGSISGGRLRESAAKVIYLCCEVKWRRWHCDLFLYGSSGVNYFPHTESSGNLLIFSLFIY